MSEPAVVAEKDMEEQIMVSSLKASSDGELKKQKTPELERKTTNLNTEYMQRKLSRNRRRQSRTTFNNQNSIIMAARHRRGYLMLMHETRIFFFEFCIFCIFSFFYLLFCPIYRLVEIVRQTLLEAGRGNEAMPEAATYDEAMEQLTALFLTMLTTEKYRKLSSFYFIFRLTDNTMLLALVVGMLMGDGDNSLKGVFNRNIAVFGVLAVEFFYGVMEYTVRIWLLNRLALYIGFALYILYCMAFTYYRIWSPLVVILLGIRFIAFISEVSVDYAIDKELENDLIEGKLTKMVLLTEKIDSYVRENCMCLSCNCCEDDEDETDDEDEEDDDNENKEEPDDFGDKVDGKELVVGSVLTKKDAAKAGGSDAENDSEFDEEDLEDYLEHGITMNSEMIEMANREGIDVLLPMPAGWRFKGSLVAWSYHNSFTLEVRDQPAICCPVSDDSMECRAELCPNENKFLFQCMLCFTIAVGLPLLIIVACVVLVLMSVRICCAKCCCIGSRVENLCRDTVCGESFQENAF